MSVRSRKWLLFCKEAIDRLVEEKKIHIDGLPAYKGFGSNEMAGELTKEGVLSTYHELVKATYMIAGNYCS